MEKNTIIIGQKPVISYNTNYFIPDDEINNVDVNSILRAIGFTNAGFMDAIKTINKNCITFGEIKYRYCNLLGTFFYNRTRNDAYYIYRFPDKKVKNLGREFINNHQLYYNRTDSNGNLIDSDDTWKYELIFQPFHLLVSNCNIHNLHSIDSIADCHENNFVVELSNIMKSHLYSEGTLLPSDVQFHDDFSVDIINPIVTAIEQSIADYTPVHWGNDNDGYGVEIPAPDYFITGYTHFDECDIYAAIYYNGKINNFHYVYKFPNKFTNFLPFNLMVMNGIGYKMTPLANYNRTSFINELVSHIKSNLYPPDEAPSTNHSNNDD